MAKEQRTFCKYCDSEYTQREYALHRVSNPHIKRIKRGLVQDGFSSVCLVCNLALKDLKHVETHVQEKTHTERMKSLLADSYLSSDKCTCDTCGITFYNEVALEVHRLMSAHESVANPPNLPKLKELARQLSGLTGERFTLNVSPLCIICNVQHDGLEDLIMHLFTPAHIFRLRSSTCFVCKRDFTHTSDRELHLNSSKHRSTLHKYSNHLEEGHRQTLLNKEGYPCMFCMVWCNSWYCLESHLLDSYHAKVSGESKAKHPVLSKINFSVSRETDCQDVTCDSSATRSWREWREETLGEGVWCHRCGIILSGLDAANRHLKDHGLERGPGTGKSHPPKALDFSSSPEIFECSVCTLSFKSAFLLRAHEACLEHHCQMAAALSTDDLRCCANCGVLVDKEDADGVTACEGLKGSQLQLNDAVNTVESGPDSIIVTNGLGGLGSASGPPIGKSSYTSRGVVDDETGIKSGSLVVRNAKCMQGSFHEGLVADGSCTQPESSYSDKILKGNSARDSSHVGCLVGHTTHIQPQLRQSNEPDNVSKDHTTSLTPHQGLVANNICIQPASCPSSEPGKTILTEEGDQWQSEVSLTVGMAKIPTVCGRLPLACAGLRDDSVQQDPVFIGAKVSDGSGSKVRKSAIEIQATNFGIPVVAAATLAPLGTLQESLQSVMAIVTEALTAALPMYMQQPASRKQKKHQHRVDEQIADQPGAKRMCPEKILEAALHQGLQSVGSNSTSMKDSDVKSQENEGFEDSLTGGVDVANKEKARHNMVDDEAMEPKAVLAVAVSVVPNSLPDLSGSAGVQGQVVVTEPRAGLAMQNSGGPATAAREVSNFVENNVKGERLLQVVVGGQGSAERKRLKMEVEEEPVKMEASYEQPISSLARTGTEKYVTAMQTPPLANDAVGHVNEDIFLEANKLPVPTTEGAMLSVLEESESNDGDCFDILDRWKGQAKWWNLSDSEGTDSVSK